MNRIPAFSIAVLLISASVALADEPKSSQIAWQNDVLKAAKTANELKKPLLIKFSASWCGYCRKMAHETFADEQIIEHISGCFVAVAVDADENGRLLQALRIEALPSTVIISPDMKVAKKLIGFQSAEQLAGHLKQFCRHDHAKKKDRTMSSLPRPAKDVGAKRDLYVNAR